MKKLKIFSLFVLLVVLLIAAGILLDLSNRLAETEFPFTDNGTSTPNVIELEANSTSTAFALLKQMASTSGWAIKSKNYESMGVFIEAIGDKENGQNNSFWLYYVNGEMPMEAADKYLLKPGDKVEFRFEPSLF